MAASTWISGVTNSTLNASVSTFSLQNALSIGGIDSYYETSPYLFAKGCTQEDQSQNCTAACMDYNQIFGSLDTLHNCMVYSTVADLYARRNLSNSNVDLAQQLSIEPSRIGSPLYNNITTTIQTCLMDSCNSHSGCNGSLHGLNASWSPSNLTSGFYIYHEDDSESEYNTWDLCDYVPQSLNQDIGGIGVGFLLR